MANLLRTASGASPIDAGLGLVRAGTVVATTNDLLALDPPGEFTLAVGGSATSGPVADLSQAAGKYDAVRLQVRFQPNTGMRYVPGQRVEDDRWENAGDLPSNFADHIHWPITRGYGTCPLTDPAEYLDRPTHTFLGFAHNGPVDVREDGAVTWRWMSGIAPRRFKAPATIRAKRRML